MAELKEIRVPDLGTPDAVPIAEIFVSPGQSVTAEEPLLALESDKAVMEIPAPFAGVIKELKVKEGDGLSTGDLIALAEPAEAVEEPAPAAPEPPAPSAAAEAPAAPPIPADASVPAAPPPSPGKGKIPHASPSVRHFARELGVELSRVTGTGPKGRIRREDIQNFVKKAVAAPAGGTGLPPLPEIDPARFGPVHTEELTRIQKLSGPRLHASWVNIPHVTHWEKADITDLEAWRKELNGRGDTKFSILAFVVKALARAVREYPRFNSVLDSAAGGLLVREYCHIGIAVDTPAGLLVPVIRDADKKSLTDIVRDIRDLAVKGREGKLTPADLQGAGISVSNLGGIGGTAFTPIINPPEVAILGLSRSVMEPVWREGEFLPRLMLPLSLSYDHRVIDGALAARFARYLSELLADFRKILL